MVTAVHVARVFESELKAARLGVHAHPAWFAVEASQCRVEHLNIDGTDVAAHPLLEHVDQEPAVLRWPGGPVSDQVSVLHVKRAVSCLAAGLAAGPVAPACVGKLELLFGHSLNDGDELDERGA